MLRHMPGDIEKRRFSADEYQLMGQVGIFSGDDRVELIDGEVVEMRPIGPVHAAAVTRATHALVRAAGAHACIRVQTPVRLDDRSEPQPDLVIARFREDFYRNAHPQPADILLVIEIADASLRYDRQIKAPLYARHGIIEYWLVDLASREITCHAIPKEGSYRESTVHGPGEARAPRSLPDCRIAADDLL